MRTCCGKDGGEGVHSHCHCKPCLRRRQTHMGAGERGALDGPATIVGQRARAPIRSRSPKYLQTTVTAQKRQVRNTGALLQRRHAGLEATMHEKGPHALGMSGGLRAWQGEGRVGANRTQPGAARPSNRKGDLTSRVRRGELTPVRFRPEPFLNHSRSGLASNSAGSAPYSVALLLMALTGQEIAESSGATDPTDCNLSNN